MRSRRQPWNGSSRAHHRKPTLRSGGGRSRAVLVTRTTAVGRPDGRPTGRALAAGVVSAALTALLAAGAGVLAVRTGAGDTTYPLLPFTVSCGLVGGLLVAVRPGNPVSLGFAVTG